MGGLLSREDTVVTTWRKYENDINKHVVELASKFIAEYCTVSPECYCSHYAILIDAFDEYLSHRMPAKHYDAYMYNHGRYSKFNLAFGGEQMYRILNTGVCIGISLDKWPTKNDKMKELLNDYIE